MLSRPARIALQVLVSGAVLAYLIWQINLRQTIDLIASSNGWYLLAAYVIFLATTLGLAWRWQVLLASKGIHEPLSWLTKLYFVGYAAGQVLPTAIGGDTVRIAGHVRRRSEAKGEVAGAVLMERVIGSAGTLVLVAVGLVLAIGRYNDIRGLVVLEIALSAGVAVTLALMFSRKTNAWLQERGGTRRLARGFRMLWDALHGYRAQPRALLVVLGATVVVQFIRILSIWLCGEAVGLDVSPLVYVVMGPLLFLVMLVPFTINGLGVREAFFIAFLGRFGVDADAAFATGFLFYAVALASSLPGAAILLWESVRPARVGAAKQEGSKT
jgi:glycosyltransferase 2 family protein